MSWRREHRHVFSPIGRRLRPPAEGVDLYDWLLTLPCCLATSSKFGAFNPRCREILNSPRGGRGRRFTTSGAGRIFAPALKPFLCHGSLVALRRMEQGHQPALRCCRGGFCPHSRCCGSGRHPGICRPFQRTAPVLPLYIARIINCPMRDAAYNVRFRSRCSPRGERYCA